MKSKLITIAVMPVVALLGILFLNILPGTVLAQQEVPAPYTGLKNPFPWSDAAAKTVGKSLYGKNCISCHGSNGNEVIEVDFSATDFPKKLEDKPDFYFWTVSEGRLAKEMIAFKTTLSETQRWQVLTYIWSLGAPPPVVEPPPGTPVPPGPPATPGIPDTPGTPATPVLSPVAKPPTLLLTVPEQALVGQPLHITALLQQDGKPVAEVPVTFSLNVTFLIGRGLAEIGEATTDDKGEAAITYTPKLAGYIPVVARYQTDNGKLVVATSVVAFSGSKQFYETEVGLPYKGFPPDLVLFPKSSWEHREMGTAPVTVLRIPGGLPFIPFMSYVAVVILVWGIYLRVMYLMLRIPITGKIKGPDTRLVPTVGIIIIALLGALMVFVLITGPYFVSF